VRGFKLVVAYDGTDFHGWQSQPGQRTVQGVLEAALQDLVGGDLVRVAGAGRTDRGVHARGQVASFSAPTRLPAPALAPALNARLPGDVRVCSSEEAPQRFHARLTARARRYSYHLLPEEDLLYRRMAWFPSRSLPLSGLARATRALEREDDFSAFRASGSSQGSPVCRVMRASWTGHGPFLRFDIVADHFLYHMVRNIVGTALKVAAAPDPAAAMDSIVASRDRRRAGVTAPAQGLCLEQVFYPEGLEP